MLNTSLRALFTEKKHITKNLPRRLENEKTKIQKRKREARLCIYKLHVQVTYELQRKAWKVYLSPIYIAAFLASDFIYRMAHSPKKQEN